MATPGQPLGEAPPTLSPTTPRSWWPGYLIAALVLVVAIVGGTIFQGQLGQFMLAGSQVVPFAILAVLAYLGVRYDWIKIISYFWLALVLIGLAGVAVLLIVAANAAPLLGTGATPEVTPPADPNALMSAIFSPAAGWAMVWALLGLIVAAILPVPAVRRAVARILPIDPASSVHAIALSLVGGSLVICFGQLIASGGSPALLNMVEAMPDAAAGAAEGQDLLTTVYAFAWTVPCALIAGGWPMVRSFGAVLRRLGMVVPTWRQVAVGIVVALLLVGAAMLIDPAIKYIWNLMGWQTTNSAAFEKLLGSLISPIGAVVIGVTAGVGEEMVVRGVLQPRLGILVSNLFFVGLHAFQYGFDALLSVFIIGLILGILRARTNTTTSAIAHGTYDFVLVMISALQAPS